MNSTFHSLPALHVPPLYHTLMPPLLILLPSFVKKTAVLSLRTRSIRRFYAVVGNMMPGFFRVCIPVIFFLLLSASYAALSFGRAKAEFENPAAAGYAVW